MASFDSTAADAILKQHYTADRVINSNYPDHPFLALVPKYEKFGGKNLPIPIKYGNTRGRSATFATAQANKKASKYEDFVLTRVSDYSLADIDNEMLEATMGDNNAFVEALVSEVDGAFEAAAESLSGALFRDGSGVIGNIDSTVTGTTLTLNDINEIVNFEVGMEIQFVDPSDLTASGLRDSGAALGITAINRATGVMTVDANLNTISGLTDGDGILVEGDIAKKLSGLDAWIPASAPGSTEFFGVNRSVDTERLGGIRVTGTNKPIEEALIEGIEKCERNGGRPNYSFVSPGKMSELKKSLGSKVQYVDVKASASISFRGVLLQGNKSEVKVLSDKDCQNDVAWMLDMRYWKLYTLGPCPKMLESDGNKILRNSDADSVEVRTGYRGNLGCRAPGFNARISLDA